jgi:aryl-alcohol dehydrogenase-like predicted oxidoreductase
MKLRRFADTGVDVSEIGFGAWAIGASWGTVDDSQSEAALSEALDRGVTFIDTADVYGDGHSERLIGKVLAGRKGPRPFVATKAGAPLRGLGPAGYDRAHLLPPIEQSLRNLRTDALDLLQLHCPPSAVYYTPEVFEALDGIVKDGKIRNYGVSVERVEDAIKAIEFPGVRSVQIIFNMFRRRPAELFFKLARERNVAIIVRVPLASGLLTGKFKRDTHFEASDHREFNRHGESFDVGETFAGVPFEAGLATVEDIRSLVPAGTTMGQFALRWILMFPEVTTVIPGAKTPAQARDNAAASDLPPIDKATMAKLQDLYDREIRQFVHQRW